MKYVSLTFFGLLFILLTAGCGRPAGHERKASASVQESCGFTMTEAGGRATVTSEKAFIVSANMPDEFLPALKDAMAVWNNALGRKIFSVAGRGDLVASQGSASSSLRWLEAWPEDGADQQADTALYIEGNVITAADVKINAQGSKFSTDDTPGTYDIESIFIHELGHVLGLKHDPSKDSVMYERLGEATERRELSETDLAHLKCGY